MSTLVVQDLEHDLELDKNAMKDIMGGWTYLGSTSSYGHYTYTSSWTTDGGYKYIGGIKYRIRNKYKKYKRNQYKTKQYQELTVVF